MLTFLIAINTFAAIFNALISFQEEDPFWNIVFSAISGTVVILLLSGGFLP